ncbi:translation elongation factor Ts [Thiomicrospira cyclica]|uniref:Elongation factor Ts n=1 Tax=Thiomicrospira cyclica (strain DSM 14477 / JCM 11371 / ALM1) TaxID=717773 RepID=F6DD01_THICA|nr:translation elongation factor Ts [Thiomicrospira cyclica]AEG31737.1 Elongation factor Ts [Thiomicrospira cyclica ALM1]
MAVSAALVKELRERTGAGMMDCKKALDENQGDLDAAIEFLRVKGMAGADKKAGRVAAEGVIAIAISDDKKSAAIAEVNCETDFVAKGDEFQGFANEVAAIALANQMISIEDLANQAMASGKTVDETRRALVAKIGENMQIRRIELIATDAGEIGSYQHGEKIGVVVAMNQGNDALIRDVAMHVAATKPQAISADDLDQAVVQKEREILTDQAKESGKPMDIIEKMIDGRIRKFLQEITLLGQPFVKDPDQTVEALLKQSNATVTRFIRLEVGEGIEKQTVNFAEEVALAAKAAQG